MKDELSAVKDGIIEKFLEILELNAGQLFVEDYKVRLFFEAFYVFFYFVYFSGPDEGFRIYLLKVDDESSANFRSGGLGQKLEFVDGCFGLINAVIFKGPLYPRRIYRYSDNNCFFVVINIRSFLFIEPGNYFTCSNLAVKWRRTLASNVKRRPFI